MLTLAQRPTLCVVGLFLLTTPAAGKPWLAPNPCIFTNGSVTWDLTPLYNGGLGYSYYDHERLFRYRFEVCGDVDPVLPSPPCPVPSAGCTLDQAPSETYCNPDYLPEGYTKTGAILQFVDNTTRTSCPVAANSPYCTTGNCVLLADGGKTPRVQPLNPLDPAGGGVTWAITSPPYSGPFDCKDGIGRTVVVQVVCDPGGLLSAPAVVSLLREDPECTYTLSFPHKRGCGVTNPSVSPSPTPSSSSSATPSRTPSRTPRPSCWPHLPPHRDHCRCRHWDGESTEPSLTADGALCDAAAPNATCPRPRPSCHPDLLGGGSGDSTALSSGAAPTSTGPTTTSSGLVAVCAVLGVLLAGALALAFLSTRRLVLLAKVKSGRGALPAPADPIVAVANPLR